MTQHLVARIVPVTVNLASIRVWSNFCITAAHSLFVNGISGFCLLMLFSFFRDFKVKPNKYRKAISFHLAL